tara:strand:+ start:464 stop:883 length:420 start_codon:yes stop_codon:yes gene_type:complete
MNDLTLGAVGELLTAAELLQRGFYLAKPVVDTDGYDLLAGTTPNQYHRIQVKTSRQPFLRGDVSPKMAMYKFNSRSRTDSDFFILCCLMHKSFYVIPTTEMPTTARLSGDGSGGSVCEKYMSAFNLLSSETEGFGKNVP